MPKLPNLRRQRIIYVALSILFLSTLTTMGLYGSPFKKIDMGFYEDGKHLYEPLATQTLVAEILNIPPRILTYTIHFSYEPQNSCSQPEEYQTFVRLSVNEDEPFAEYASRAFNEKSCYFDFTEMPQHHKEWYYFCLKGPGTISFPYPADRSISFSSILMSNGTCPLENEIMQNRDLKFYATPSLREWAIGWVGVSLVWVLIMGGFLTIREYIRKG
ncbi:hypothetical protein A2110_00465 [Candidatus Jorgensenbacteria bacterium GWA1_54_12]|uniref:Uncharacterized protein n=1 Tax=Candidatus Jorgensenbacteria bacterium GWA1_54_12 TaxID=1798468 RepID=A0A1F6BL03_9BACT|nr:MAG: hypothetical protein A2110_00465 [Candidatus Jorgensenbacteria bacterium GWA1_54_12]